MKLETTLYQTVLNIYLYFKVNFLLSLEKSAPATLLNFSLTSFLISSMHDANNTCLKCCLLFWKKKNIHKISSQPHMASSLRIAQRTDNFREVKCSENYAMIKKIHLV